jgi:tRNA1Val (adenine37-N6)-methyltransferase
MISVKPSNAFTFKKFTIKQEICTMKVNTDGILLGAWADISNAKKILDIGTGTGVIALMIAQRNELAKIIGIDIDDNSCLEAAENVANSIFRDNVKIIHTSIQTFSNASDEHYDLIISNPPFFTGGTFSANENKANVRHTIKLPHGDLLNAVTTLLSPTGNFALILPYIEGLRFIELAERSNLHLTHCTEVKHKSNKPVERLLINLSKIKQKLSNNEIMIKEDDGNTYSKEFIALTKDFYQHF